MSRTTSGNLTGTAAHGTDDVYASQTEDYKEMLDLSSRVKEIFGDPLAYVSWQVRVPEGKLVEYMKEIISQVEETESINEWLGVSPTRANVKVIPNQMNSVRFPVMIVEGTEPSPTIWGGEIYYPEQSGDGKIPF
jgi:hypothetical protein